MFDARKNSGPTKMRLPFDLPTYLDRSSPPPKLRCSPREGTPVALVTGVSVTQFDPNTHHRTATKAHFPDTPEVLCNVSLPFALRLAQSGQRVVAQCHPRQRELLAGLLALQPWSGNVRLLAADLGTSDWASEVDDVIHSWSMEEAVSRVDLMLYESYTADISRPFVPTWEEDVGVLAAAIERRICFYKTMSEYGYRLLLTCQQPELRVVALTALASFRPVAYLFADGAHKVVSSKFLQTWAIESAAHCEQPVAVVELCPGVVDTGLYDPPGVRTVAWMKADLNGQPFEDNVDPKSVETWPMLSPDVVAELGCAYFSSEWGDDAGLHELGRRYQAVLSGGRSQSQMSDVCWRRERGVQLPLYASYPGYRWGSLPPLKPGYQPVFLTPVGQMV